MAVWLSQRIVLACSHDDPSPNDGQPYILIHAGNKFGTGNHPTTRICLAIFERILQEEQSVLDLGTGTGILAICAAKLRASRVVAIDQDFDACKIAMHNIMNNGLGNATAVINGRLDALSENGPLANLELGTLIQVVPLLRAHLHSNGLLVTSGVLRSAQTDLSNLLASSGFIPLSSFTEGEWVGLLASPAP